MIDLSAYAELHKRTEDAFQQFADAASAAFGELRKIDPELAQLAIHVYGRLDVVATAFAQPCGQTRKSIYAELAAGGREDVLNEMLKVTHGIF